MRYDDTRYNGLIYQWDSDPETHREFGTLFLINSEDVVVRVHTGVLHMGNHFDEDATQVYGTRNLRTVGRYFAAKMICGTASYTDEAQTR